MDSQVAQRIVEIIAVELQVPVERIQAGRSFRKDLGMDSVAALNILFAAEEAFDVHVPEGELENVDDLDAILRLIERYETRGMLPPTGRDPG